ncbi:MAG: Fur family transcriptional regulator [Terriglobales bacterium]
MERVGLKRNAERDTILRTFLQAREPVCPEELHLQVRRRDPDIGFTTVYRTLKVLTQCGLAVKVGSPDGVSRYEHHYNRRSRHHMVCTECGRSVEFFSLEVGRVEREMGRKYRYQPTRHAFEIYGLCEECRRNSARRTA